MRQFLWAQIKKHCIITSICVALLIILLFDLGGLTGNAWIMNITAFVVGLFTLLFIEIKKQSKLTDKIIRPIGFILVFCIVLIVEAYTRYELQTTFYKPCWSPDGKQIAFFMEKALYRYHFGFPFSLWSPDDIWKKYYLCTMDYDGKNFKQIKQAEQATDEISWSGSGEIVYTTDITGLEQIMKMNLINGEQQELYKANKKTRLHDPWLSKDKKYIGFLYKVDSDNYRLMVIDLEQNKEILSISEKIFTPYRKSYYGSFCSNEIAYSLIKKLNIYTLDLKKQKTIDINNDNEKYLLLPNFDYGSISPDQQMNTNDVFRKYNEIYGIQRTKRSYLFNIFGK